MYIGKDCRLLVGIELIAIGYKFSLTTQPPPPAWLLCSVVNTALLYPRSFAALRKQMGVMAEYLAFAMSVGRLKAPSCQLGSALARRWLSFAFSQFQSTRIVGWASNQT